MVLLLCSRERPVCSSHRWRGRTAQSGGVGSDVKAWAVYPTAGSFRSRFRSVFGSVPLRPVRSVLFRSILFCSVSFYSVAPVLLRESVSASACWLLCVPGPVTLPGLDFDLTPRPADRSRAPSNASGPGYESFHGPACIELALPAQHLVHVGHGAWCPVCSTALGSIFCRSERERWRRALPGFVMVRCCRGLVARWGTRGVRRALRVSREGFGAGGSGDTSVSTLPRKLARACLLATAGALVCEESSVYLMVALLRRKSFVWVEGRALLSPSAIRARIARACRASAVCKLDGTLGCHRQVGGGHGSGVTGPRRLT